MTSEVRLTAIDSIQMRPRACAVNKRKKDESILNIDEDANTLVPDGRQDLPGRRQYAI